MPLLQLPLVKGGEIRAVAMLLMGKQEDRLAGGEEEEEESFRLSTRFGNAMGEEVAAPVLKEEGLGGMISELHRLLAARPFGHLDDDETS